MVEVKDVWYDGTVFQVTEGEEDNVNCQFGVNDGMVNLFPYASAIALSGAFPGYICSIYSQFNAVFHATVTRDDALSDSISLF